MPLLLDGLKLTIGIALLAIALGMVIGFLSCIMGMSKNPVLRAISAVYVWLIRGTPMLVQAFFVFYAIPQLVKVMTGTAFTLTPFTAGAITLSLNAGAYISEIFRGGIQAVPKGQTEAARSLGLSSAKTMLRVVLPQAIRTMIPSIINQFIITLKDTSILSVIGFPELVNTAKNVVANTMSAFQVWTIVAVMYLVVITLLSRLAKKVERRLNRGRQ